MPSHQSILLMIITLSQWSYLFKLFYGMYISTDESVKTDAYQEDVAIEGYKKR